MSFVKFRLSSGELLPTLDSHFAVERIVSNKPSTFLLERDFAEIQHHQLRMAAAE